MSALRETMATVAVVMEDGKLFLVVIPETGARLMLPLDAGWARKMGAALIEGAARIDHGKGLN